jgi:(1->4)-alpha-D-glucan 1-alpha-D-glucosylmutase
VDPDTEYFLWQTFVGSWPLTGYRLTGYLTKAVREAKRQTSWTDPDPDYEAAVLGLAARILGDSDLVTDIRLFVDEISPDAMVNSLGAKLVQLTMPGVPDVYQGCEVAALSLVDPDNRRAVDFTGTGAELTELDASLDASRRDGFADGDPDRFARAKLLVTSRALRLRRARPEWFAGGYEPLAASGPAAGHALAFRRGGQAVTVVTRLPVGLRRRGGWQDTALSLPVPPSGGAWADLLTGAVHRGPAVPMAELTGRLPVALLVPEVE